MEPSSESKNPPPAKPELHLGRFVTHDPTPAGEPEGATMIIKRAAVETARNAEKTAGPGDSESDLPLSVMLGLISYCYARGIFRSDDIARRLQEQPELAAAFGGNLPDGPAVRRFRRRHSEEIEETLETLYRELPSDAPTDTVHIQRQAKDRVHDAAWTDNTSR